MGIRQSFNENKVSSVVIIVLIIAGAVTLGVWYSRPRTPVDFGAHEFFSDDDGASWFVDDATRLAPFIHNGKQAVLAKVFQCGNGKQFVGYLEKLSDETKQQVETARAAGPGHGVFARPTADGFNGPLIKKPGGLTWLKKTAPAAVDVLKVTCPDGGTEVAPVAAP